MNTVARGDDTSQPPVSVSPDEIDLRVSGRFDRGLGHSLSLRDLPVRWSIDDTGSILLETYIEQDGGIDLALPLSDKSGPWSLIVPRETLVGGTEEGMLYFGLTARPAFRLTLSGRRMTAILSVKNASELIKLSRLFDVLLAESAAKAASFFGTTLNANASRPSPNQPPEPIDRQEKPGDEIPWKNLIDFSR